MREPMTGSPKPLTSYDRAAIATEAVDLRLDRARDIFRDDAAKLINEHGFRPLLRHLSKDDHHFSMKFPALPIFRWVHRRYLPRFLH